MAVNLGPCACWRHCLELNFGQKYATAGSIGNHVHLHSRVFVLQTSAPSVGLQILHFDLRVMQLLRSLDRNFLDHFNLKTSPVSLIDFGFKIIHAWIGNGKFSCWLKMLMQKKWCKLRLSALLLEDGVDEFKGLFQSDWNLHSQSEASSNTESFNDNIPDKQLFCVQ